MPYPFDAVSFNSGDPNATLTFQEIAESFSTAGEGPEPSSGLLTFAGCTILSAVVVAKKHRSRTPTR
jgi:hypothetical protein